MTTRTQRTRATVILGFGIALLAMMFVGALATHMTTLFVTSARQVTATGETVARLEEVLRWISRAESEQRGFVLTGRERYLMLYDPAVAQSRKMLTELYATADKRDKVEVQQLAVLAQRKVAEMDRVIQLRRLKGPDAAVAYIGNDEGLALMDRVRSQFQVLRDRQSDRLQKLEVVNTRNRLMTLLLVPLGLMISVFALLIATVLMLRDGSRIRYAEASLNRALALQSAILNGASVGVIAIDTDGIVTLFNATAEKWLGRRATEVVGRNCVTDFLEPVEVQEREASLLLEYGTSVQGFEVLAAPARKNGLDTRAWTHVRADGSTFPAVVSVAPLLDETARVFGYVIVSVDLTEREDTQQELARNVAALEHARSALEEQNQLLEASRDAAIAATNLKSEFLANMSHEIRTPMNGIIGIAHLLMGTPLSDKQKAYAHTVQQSAESLLRILNDILDLSKIEARKMTVDRYPFDLRSVIQETLDALGPLAEEKRLRVEVSVAQDVPTELVGDSHRLRQVLSNLLSNAIKFTHAGSVNLGIEALRETGTTVEFRFAVRDTGIGIPKDRLEAIFESFTQADMTTARSFGGTGLGLAISKQIVSLMGGELMVSSIEGQGSEFSFVISLERPALPEGSRLEPDSPEADLGGARILVVDDDASERALIQQWASAWNGLAVTTTAVEEALRVLANDMQFAVGIVSLSVFPGADVECARRMRSTEGVRRIPLVLVCSRNDSATESSGLFAAILTKPIKNSVLRKTISMLVGVARDSRNSDELFARSLPGLRVLVVEDNPTNQLVVEAMLAGWQCHVETVQSGQAAVDRLQVGTFDAVLMDVQMPGMDGLEATRRIRASERLTKKNEWIIAMTANARPSDRDACLQAGMDRYLAKPISAPALFAELEARLPVSKPEPESEPLLNLDRLRETCQGKPSLELKVLERYEENLEAALGEIEESLRASDRQHIRVSAHALKGSSLTVGAERLGSLLKRLELESAAGVGGLEPSEAVHLRVVGLHTRDAVIARIRELEAR